MATAHQLQCAYRLAGDAAKADEMAGLVKRKMADVTETADARLSASRSRLEQRETQAAAAQAAISTVWNHAHRSVCVVFGAPCRHQNPSLPNIRSGDEPEVCVHV